MPQVRQPARLAVERTWDEKDGGKAPTTAFSIPHRKTFIGEDGLLHNHHKSNRRASPVVFGPCTLPRHAGRLANLGHPSCFDPELLAGTLLLSILLLLSSLTSAAQPTAQAALTSALQGTPAVGLVVDVKTGRQLAAVRAINERHAPGSILKPLFLAAALEQHEVLPETTVFCRRNLHISDGTRDWNLACTHPQSDVAFTAKEALAYSCNRYFAELADRIPPAQASAILEHYGLAPTSIPQSREQKELLVLGVAGIAVSPAQMAVAYRRLALELDQANAPAVREGLRDSVTYGMAHNADVPGMEIAGKTGTAGDGAQGRSHGWFAGTGHLGHDEVVVVIYLPLGNGADAARLAHNFFLAASPPAPESARLLTVELFSTRTVKALTATPLGQPAPNPDELGAGWPPALFGNHGKATFLEWKHAHASRRRRCAGNFCRGKMDHHLAARWPACAADAAQRKLRNCGAQRRSGPGRADGLAQGDGHQHTHLRPGERQPP